MAINVTATSVKTQSGFNLTSFHIRVRKMEQETEDSMLIRLRLFKDDAEFIADPKNDFWVDEIPEFFAAFTAPVTPAQFANADNSQIQTRIAELIEQGDSHVNWNDYFPNRSFAGLSGTYAVVMPA